MDRMLRAHGVPPWGERRGAAGVARRRTTAADGAPTLGASGPAVARGHRVADGVPRRGAPGGDDPVTSAPGGRSAQPVEPAAGAGTGWRRAPTSAGGASRAARRPRTTRRMAVGAGMASLLRLPGARGAGVARRGDARAHTPFSCTWS